MSSKPPLLYSLLGILLLLGAVAGQTVTAQSISFSDLGYGSELDLLLYDSDGNFVVECNSTSSGIHLDPNTSYVCIIKPSQQRRFWDPATLVVDTAAFIETYFIQLAIGAGCIALALSAFRRR